MGIVNKSISIAELELLGDLHKETELIWTGEHGFKGETQVDLCSA